MKIYLHIRNKEFTVQEKNVQRFKEHLEYLSELIQIYEDTKENVTFIVPNDLID